MLAVALVLGRHMPDPPDSWSRLGQLPFLMWIRGGWIGVDLFFVLSGFLVSGLLFSEFKMRGRLGISRFYVRRGWKIYPPFFVMIAATIVAMVCRRQSIPSRAFLAEICFVQSYFSGLWNHTWSLAVEEHFYILLPMALALILRCNRNSPTPLRPVLSLAIIVALASVALRVANWYVRSSFTFTTHVFASHLRLDSLLFGVAISYAYHFHSEAVARRFTPWQKHLVLGGTALLLPPFIFRLETTPLLYTVGLSVLYLASGMILMGILTTELPQNRLVTALAALGGYSYSIYLWHMPVLTGGLRLVEDLVGRRLDYSARILLYLVASFVVGVVMAKLVEMPALRLRDLWFPSRGPGAVELRPTRPLHVDGKPAGVGMVPTP